MTQVLSINLCNIIELKYDSVRLPSKSIQGETVTVSINLINTGKSTIHNAMINVDIKRLDNSCTVFIGALIGGTLGFGILTQYAQKNRKRMKRYCDAIT